MAIVPILDMISNLEVPSRNVTIAIGDLVARLQPADGDSGPVAVATGGDSARRNSTMGSVGDRAEHAATTHGQRRADHGRAL